MDSILFKWKLRLTNLISMPGGQPSMCLIWILVVPFSSNSLRLSHSVPFSPNFLCLSHSVSLTHSPQHTSLSLFKDPSFSLFENFATEDQFPLTLHFHLIFVAFFPLCLSLRHFLPLQTLGKHSHTLSDPLRHSHTTLFFATDLPSHSTLSSLSQSTSITKLCVWNANNLLQPTVQLWHYVPTRQPNLHILTPHHIKNSHYLFHILLKFQIILRAWLSKPIQISYDEQKYYTKPLIIHFISVTNLKQIYLEIIYAKMPRNTILGIKLIIHLIPMIKT